MASAGVVSVLLVCGVVTGRVRDNGVQRLAGPGSISEHVGEHSVRATTSTSFIPYNAPGLQGRMPPVNSSSLAVKDDNTNQRPNLQRRIGYTQEQMYPLLIPVKFDVNPELVYSEQRSRSRSNPSEDPRQQTLNSSPRLIMDKDFNIRFDNPYIVPVSKPLAFVLDSSAAGRSVARGPYGNKMMIPFPVLVQARSPMPEEAEYGKYRDPGEYVEHRSNDDDDDFPGESFGRHPPRKLGRSRKPWKNNTSSYKDTSSKSVRTSDNPTEEESFNESSDGPNVYPSKIFEDMYRSMPKYPLDSQESRERERPYDDTRRKYSKSKEAATSPTKEPAKQQRQRARPTSKYAFSRQPVFSATSDLEWVTHINSTASKRPAASDESGSMHDSVDVTTTTTDPLQPPEAALFHQPTTISPAEADINKHYWREA